MIMRKYLSFGTVLLLIGAVLASGSSKAQSTSFQTDPVYFQKNLALTNFVRLGVDGQTFARCVRAVNYLEPAITPKLARLKGEEFRDDGQGFDLRANDGILTSVKSFSYLKGETVIPAGQYQKSASEYVVHDELFEHIGTERLPFPGIRIRCKARTIFCSDLPEPARTFCYRLGPPYSSIEFYDCEIEISLW